MTFRVFIALLVEFVLLGLTHLRSYVGVFTCQRGFGVKLKTLNYLNKNTRNQKLHCYYMQ